jgi:uncharacterized protein (DUF2344 family)
LSSKDGAVSVSVTQERWDKAKKIVKWIREIIANSEVLDHKTLESHRGFLIYLV